MEKLIAFFNEDENWQLNTNRAKPLSESIIQTVAKQVGYKSNSRLAYPNVQEFITDKIHSILSGDDIKRSQFSIIEEHFELSYFASNKKKHVNAYKFIVLLRSHGIRPKCYTFDELAWKEAKKLLEMYYFISPNTEPSLLPSSSANKKIVESFLFLNEQGYQPSIVRGKITLKPKDEKRILDAINYRLKKLNSLTVFNVLNNLEKKYNQQLGRYFLRSEPSSIGQYRLDIPWGYIYNLAIQHLSPVKETRKHRLQFLQMVELAQHYLSIKRYQTFSKFEDIDHSHDTILAAIQKHILYDQHFALDQITPEHLIAILDGFFNSPAIAKYNVDITIFIDIIKFLSANQWHKQVKSFNAANIMQFLFPKYDLTYVSQCLDLLSMADKEVNKGYLQPDEIQKRNYFLKPLIKTNNDYFYISPYFNNYGFYMSILEYFKQHNSPITNNDRGDAAEQLVLKHLSRHGVTFMHSKEYKIPKNVSKEFASNHENAECDLIIETKETIYFFEIKCKTLTSNARAGNSYDIAIDVAGSLIHPISQACVHEYMLRRNGKLTFVDGTVLNHHKREVEKVALTLFDFNGVQDGEFIKQIVSSLINAEVFHEERKAQKQLNKSFNKHLSLLQNIVKSPIFSEVYKFNELLFSFRSFSVPQLMTLLANCSDNESFKREFTRTRHMTIGAHDWYQDYWYSREIEKATK